MKAYENTAKRKLELDFGGTSVEEMKEIQEAIVREISEKEQEMMKGFLSVEALRTETRELITIFIPDIIFTKE